MSKKDKPFKGWQCPRCKQINAPWVPYCDCEEEKEVLQTITWDADKYQNVWDKQIYTTGTSPNTYYTTVTSNASNPSSSITLNTADIRGTNTCTITEKKENK